MYLLEKLITTSGDASKGVPEGVMLNPVENVEVCQILDRKDDAILIQLRQTTSIFRELQASLLPQHHRRHPYTLRQQAVHRYPMIVTSQEPRDTG